MTAPLNPFAISAKRALISFDLGTSCSEFKHQFRQHALQTQLEAECEVFPDCSHLEELLDSILDEVIATAADVTDSETMNPNIYFQNEHAVAVDSVKCFLGAEGGISQEWQSIVDDYTTLIDLTEDLSDQSYFDEIERLEDVIDHRVPSFVRYAEAIGDQLPDNQRCFFLLGRDLTDYYRKCLQFQLELDQLSAQKQVYFTHYIRLSIEGFQATIRECALRLPKANIHAPRDMGLRDLQLCLMNWHQHVHSRLKSAAESESNAEMQSEVITEGVQGQGCESLGSEEFWAKLATVVVECMTTSALQNQSEIQGLTSELPQSSEPFVSRKTIQSCDKPEWNKETRELSFRGQVHKFASQIHKEVITLLDVFQECNWQEREYSSINMDNLKERIRALNNAALPLRFSKDGDQITWRSTLPDTKSP